MSIFDRDAEILEAVFTSTYTPLRHSYPASYRYTSARDTELEREWRISVFLPDAKIIFSKYHGQDLETAYNLACAIADKHGYSSFD